MKVQEQTLGQKERWRHRKSREEEEEMMGKVAGKKERMAYYRAKTMLSVPSGAQTPPFPHCRKVFQAVPSLKLDSLWKILLFSLLWGTLKVKFRKKINNIRCICCWSYLSTEQKMLKRMPFMWSECSLPPSQSEPRWSECRHYIKNTPGILCVKKGNAKSEKKNKLYKKNLWMTSLAGLSQICEISLR